MIITLVSCILQLALEHRNLGGPINATNDRVIAMILRK